MMEIHIINLKSRPDRRNSVTIQIETQQQTGRFWDGILVKGKASRGIALAHQQIVAWAKSQGLPKVTIAEDDVIFTAPGAIDWYWQNEPPGYDLYLGGINYGEILDQDLVLDFSGTHFYTVRSNFYDTFLSLDGERDIDRALASRGRFVVCNPMIAFQADGYSDNRKRHLSFSAYLEGRDWWQPPTH